MDLRCHRRAWRSNAASGPMAGCVWPCLRNRIPTQQGSRQCKLWAVSQRLIKEGSSSSRDSFEEESSAKVSVLDPPAQQQQHASTSSSSFATTTASTDSDMPSPSPASLSESATLFNRQHVRPSWQMLPLALYAPLGLLLACVRMACWVLGVLIDASWFRQRSVVDTYLKILGFKTHWRNLHLIPQGHHVMVSNHTTSSDLMVLFSLPQRYTHLITTAMPARVLQTKNLPVVLRPAAADVYEQLAREHAAAGPAAPPVHVFPEGGLTNGSGMLQFSRGFMKFVMPGTPVVPVALKARTPWGIQTHTLTSSFLSNLFWLSFCPWVEVEAVVLPPTTAQPGEGRGAFVQRVQQSIADELQVPVSSMSIQQKRQLMKQASKKRL